MPSLVTPPHLLVDVGLAVSEPAYLTLAEGTYGTASLPWFRALGDLLYGRPGWSCALTLLPQNDGTDLNWSYGALNRVLFTIDYEDDAQTFQVLEPNRGVGARFESIDDLGAWLDENESQHAERLKIEMRPAISEATWTVLKNHVFDVEVAFDGASWIATIGALPMSFASGESLSGAVAAARQNVVHTVELADDVADQVQMRVRLEPTASAAL